MKAIEKSGQILQKQAKSNEILTKFGKISTRSCYTWWDLAKSQQFLTKNVDSNKKMQIPVIKSRFQWLFLDSSENFQIPAIFFFSRFRWLFFLFFFIFYFLYIYNFDDWPNRPMLTLPKIDSINFSSDRFRVPPPNAGGLSLCWVQNPPGPTYG